MNILFPNSPIVKLSLVLAFVSCGLLLLVEVLGISKQQYYSELTARKKATSTIAIQVSSAIKNFTFASLDNTLLSLVEYDESILSIGIRRDSGELTAVAGAHDAHWRLDSGSTSTVTQIRIPLFNRDMKWGDLEISFAPIERDSFGSVVPVSFLWVFLFMLIGGTTSNLFFLRKALNDLDPNAVVPQQVSSALDVLAEGLVVVDTHELILLANASFCRIISCKPEDLVGVKLSSLNWVNTDGSKISESFPWYPILAGTGPSSDTHIKLAASNNSREPYTFSVHAVAVTTPDDQLRGAIITFDDLTPVEHKNRELRTTLDKLESVQEDMARQNKELYVLATRDGLSNALNRRALFDAFEEFFIESQSSQNELCCIMSDIDKFKSINDRFGHGVGDKVIKGVANILQDKVRASDIVGRYGGEEFCIVLPSTTLDQAIQVAEEIRREIHEMLAASVDLPDQVTSSFGVASTLYNAVDPLELCNQADKALYVAKKSGRNKTVGWPSVASFDENTETTEPAVLPAEKTDSNSLSRNIEANTKKELLDKIEQLSNELVKSERVRANMKATVSGKTAPNLKILHDRVDQSIFRSKRNDTSVAVIVIECAAYRDVNSAHGINYSESLIDALDERIHSELRDTDTVSSINSSNSHLFLVRSSEDKFVLVLADLNENGAVARVVARIQESLLKVFLIDGKEFYVTPCMGLAVAPLDGDDAITLIANAHAALDQANSSSGSEGLGYCFYSSDMNESARSMLSLESELRQALDRQEFELFYQPRIDCTSGKINGFEALIRWNHPTRGLVMPDKFIPLAEKARLIEKMGEWVISTACHQLADWTKLGFDKLEMSVNVSPVQMRNSRLVDVLTHNLSITGLDAARLEIEITESVLLDNVDSVITLMQQIVDAGITIALDDFGTGYSCLSYLTKLPLQRLKIDRSFISSLGDNIDDYAIVGAVVEMAHAMNMKIVVEGVEEATQWVVLRELGCDELQGYHLGRPTNAQEALNLLLSYRNLQPELKLIKGSTSQITSEIERVDFDCVINDASIHSAVISTPKLESMTNTRRISGS